MWQALEWLGTKGCPTVGPTHPLGLLGDRRKAWSSWTLRPAEVGVSQCHSGQDGPSEVKHSSSMTHNSTSSTTRERGNAVHKDVHTTVQPLEPGSTLVPIGNRLAEQRVLHWGPVAAQQCARGPRHMRHRGPQDLLAEQVAPVGTVCDGRPGARAHPCC